LASRIKTALFSGFNRLINLIAGKGLGKIPGARSAYHLIFKTLWPDRNIIEVEGSKMYVNLKDELVMRKTFEAYITTPHWDELMSSIFKEVTKEGDVVLDLGANLGYFSLLASKLVGKKGKVYSFEPEPRNYRLLCKNIELNAYENIFPFQKAVSDQPATVRLSLSSEDSGAHTIREHTESNGFQDSVEVEAVKLDEFLSDKTRRVNVVKMDIEGSEPKAFTGMEKIIDENRDIKIFVEFFPSLLQGAGCPAEEFARRLMEDYLFSVTALDDDWKGRRHRKVSSVAELMEFLGDKKIINLYLEKNTSWK